MCAKPFSPPPPRTRAIRLLTSMRVRVYEWGGPGKIPPRGAARVRAWQDSAHDHPDAALRLLQVFVESVQTDHRAGNGDGVTGVVAHHDAGEDRGPADDHEDFAVTPSTGARRGRRGLRDSGCVNVAHANGGAAESGAGRDRGIRRRHHSRVGCAGGGALGAQRSSGEDQHRTEGREGADRTKRAMHCGRGKGTGRRIPETDIAKVAPTVCEV
jgi:hypothetical protein